MMRMQIEKRQRRFAKTSSYLMKCFVYVHSAVIMDKLGDNSKRKCKEKRLRFNIRSIQLTFVCCSSCRRTAVSINQDNLLEKSCRNASNVAYGSDTKFWHNKRQENCESNHVFYTDAQWVTRFSFVFWTFCEHFLLCGARRVSLITIVGDAT